MTIVVNMSDARVSSDAGDVLATYSLGSCIGVTLYDSVARVGGMLHYQLPSGAMDMERSKRNPLMFADSGMEWLLGKMAQAGAEKRRMKVRIAGAAQMLNDATMFAIGKRNHTAIRKIVWQHGMFIDAEDVGGVSPRHLYLSIADGSVSVKSHGETRAL